MCPGGREGQRHPGVCQRECGRQEQEVTVPPVGGEMVASPSLGVSQSCGDVALRAWSVSREGQRSCEGSGCRARQPQSLRRVLIPHSGDPMHGTSAGCCAHGAAFVRSLELRRPNLIVQHNTLLEWCSSTNNSPQISFCHLNNHNCCLA